MQKVGEKKVKCQQNQELQNGVEKNRYNTSKFI